MQCILSEAKRARQSKTQVNITSEECSCNTSEEELLSDYLRADSDFEKIKKLWIENDA